MKNKFLIGALSVGVILGGFGVASASITNDKESKNNDKESKENLLTEQEATEIAEKTVDGIVVDMDLDEDDGQYIYEFDLETSSGEAEVEIDAVTGKVLESINESVESIETVQNDEWTSLPESNKIKEIIDNQEYNVQTVTDNEGKRVLLFVDNKGVEQYKTIFIKNINRLKIIDLNNGQIFNGIIK